jgi:hypothetical protein
MPMDKELWLGVREDAARLVANTLLGEDWKTMKSFQAALESGYAKDMPLGEKFFAPCNQKLNGCYLEALQALGLTPKRSNANGYVITDTPSGRREMAGWSLGFQYDPNEVGAPPVLGIGLTGRYFPTLLDWRDQHGTMDSCSDLGQVIAEANKVIPIIHRELPFTKDWGLLLVDVFY